MVRYLTPPSMQARTYRLAAIAALLLAAPLSFAVAQGIDLTINHVGLAIGDVPRVIGLRLNFRDRNLERVDGMNVTIWTPYNDGTGLVRGVALGLPATGAEQIDGLAVGLLGVGAKGRIRGIGIAPIGLGAGGSIEGLMIAGVGVGGGSSMTGIGIGGVGVGGGGKMRGLFVGGVGVGSGGGLDGIAVGGVGVGGGGDVRGIAIGGVGVGGGGNVTGLAIGGVGVGSGGDVSGISIGGIGVGAGGTIRGLAIGGIGVGAPAIRGIAISAIAVGGQNVCGVMIAGAWMQIEKEGEIRGMSVSAFNLIKGSQRGLAIGIVNFANELHGMQVGLINIARNNSPGTRVLPIVNYHGR